MNFKLHCPIVVRQEKHQKKSEYVLRPLFFPSPSIRHRRYDAALSQMRQELRSRLKSVKLDREQMERLLWFGFMPKDLQHQVANFQFIIGKRSYQGDFSLVWFSLKGSTYVVLPGFNSHIFGLPGEGLVWADLREEAERIIGLLLREMHQDEDLDTDSFKAHLAQPGEHISPLKFVLKIEAAPFNFDGTEDDFLRAFLSGDNEDFDGEMELNVVGQSFNERYPGQLRRAPHREDLAERLNRILYGVENNPIVLLGEEGVGKHSLLQEVVYRYMQQSEEEAKTQDEDKEEFRQQAWMLDPNRVIAGMSVVGAWQRRFEAILQHLQNRIAKLYEKEKKPAQTPSDILVVDNVVALVRIGQSSQNSMTLSDVLKPYLEQRKLQVVLLATPQEWKLLQERSRRFADLFQIVRVPEPDTETSVRMMLALRQTLEQEHECEISISAMRELYRIARQYFRRKAHPGVVAKMLRQLAVKYRNRTVDVAEAQEEFQLYSGLRFRLLDQERALEEAEVYKHIEGRLIGQPQAVKALSELVHLIKSKLNNPDKPLASMLFIGPTGVGKTEAAKVLSDYLMGSEERLLRFDMNEYIDPWALSRLIGDEQNPEGQLTGRIRYNPFGIVLFDEIEKAHPKIHDILLQVLDDARLTDALGRVVDFSNTVIIMTSNLGAQEAASQLGFDTVGRDEGAVYRKAVNNFFRPEFVNRIDRMVVFEGLKPEHILDIAKLQIRQLLSRDGFVRRTTILSIEEEALDWVARRGYQAKMGGRALKRQIERDLTAFSADMLLKADSDVPVIFHIGLEHDRLKPRIEALQFAEPLAADWLPPSLNEKVLKPFYGALLDDVRYLANRLDAQLGTQAMLVETKLEDWAYYQLKNRVQEKQEYLNRILLSIEDHLLRLPSNALRLKSSGYGNIIWKGNKMPRHNPQLILMKDQLFRQSALDELRYVYQHAPMQFNNLQSAYLDDFFDLAFLHLGIEHYNEGMQQLELRIEGVVPQRQNAEACRYLHKHFYGKFFEALGIHAEALSGEVLGYKLEGYGLRALLQGEQGYHLFYYSKQAPLPLTVSLYDSQTGHCLCPPEERHVLRVYDLLLGSGHRHSTVTDLRSGYTGQAMLTEREIKPLIYAGLAENDRLTLW